MKHVRLYLLIPFLILACKASYHKQSENFTHFPLNNESEKNAAVDSLVKPYYLKLSDEMNRVIGNSSAALVKNKSQNTLGNFVCDALMFESSQTFKGSNVDIALINNGGLRSALPAGIITVGNVFELMPFDNKLVLLKISGAKLLKGLNTIVRKKHVYCGMQLVVKNDSIIKCLIKGRVINTEESYYIVTSDYLANGGDSFTFLNDPLQTNNSNVLVREAIINYCESLSKSHKQIIPYTDDRLVETR